MAGLQKDADPLNDKALPKEARPKSENTSPADSEYLFVSEGGSPNTSFQNMTGFLGHVTPMGEDMRPNVSSQSGSEPDAVVPRGDLIKFSQTRLDRAKSEFKQAAAEINELNPPRDGPMGLRQIKRWADRNITENARERRPGRNIWEYCVNPDNIRKARIGPGNKLDDKLYQTLAQPRLAANTKEGQPGTFAQDDDDDDSSMDSDEAWLRKRVDTLNYIGQWAAYKASPPMYPKVTNGVLSLQSSSVGFVSDHKPMPSEVENPKPYMQFQFKHNFGFFPSDHYDPPYFRVRFFEWLNNLPKPDPPMDICHVAFFDGTASPDGGSGLMILRDKPGSTNRDNEDELTRNHSHETAAGYSWNIKIQLQAVESDEIERDRRRLRICGSLEPSMQRLHHYLILRPAEPDDAENLIPLFNWYSENTTFNPRQTPVVKEDIIRVIQACRNLKLPFIVAVPDRRIRVFERRPDEPEILGFAYVQRFNSEASTGEVRLFVDRTCKKLWIGSGLLDMILRTCDTRYVPGPPRPAERPYEFLPRDGLEYSTNYPCNLTRLVFAIAFEPTKESKYLWVRRWLIKNFQFENLGILKQGRVKFGHRYVPCLSS